MIPQEFDKIASNFEFSFPFRLKSIMVIYVTAAAVISTMSGQVPKS